MKIKLEYPYNQDFKVGYLRTNRENRQTLYLVKNGQNKVTNSTAYARYLLAVKNGRYLESDEQADHIDNNKTNDSLDNLQILSKIENIKKIS